MAVDIQFQDLSTKTKTILQASTTLQSQAAKDGYQIIVQTAKQFNQKYEIMLNQINNFETQLKHTIKAWHEFKASCQQNGEEYKNTTQYDQYLKDRARIRSESLSIQTKQEILDTYTLAMQFQEYLNAALGQQIATTYVWVGAKGIPETYVIHDMSKFLKLDVDRYGNVVVRYRNNLNMLKNHAQKIEASIQNNENFNYTLLKSTYHTTFERYNNYKVAKGGAYVLWLYPYEGQKWNGIYVSSFGSVNEAYATLLLHERFNPSNTPEDNMEQFMNEVLNVTNLSGTLEGDTTVGLMQMAVKSKNATTLSIAQLYNISQTIVNSKLTNFNAIKQYLIETKRNNKQVEAAINISLKQSLQNIADENLPTVIENFL